MVETTGVMQGQPHWKDLRLKRRDFLQLYSPQPNTGDAPTHWPQNTSILLEKRIQRVAYRREGQNNVSPLDTNTTRLVLQPKHSLLPTYPTELFGGNDEPFED